MNTEQKYIDTVLLIDETWVQRIFARKRPKIWEIRGSNHHKHVNRIIAIGKKGYIYGQVKFMRAFQVTPQCLLLQENQAKHQIEDLSAIGYKTPYVWEFADAIRYEHPLKFETKRGVVQFQTLTERILVRRTL